MTRPRASRRKAPAEAPASFAGDLPPPLPNALLAEPLEYLMSEHHRHRIYLAALRDAAETGHLDGRHLPRLARFLIAELPEHRQDEECDLFPALARLAQPEDGIGDVLQQLRADHTRTASLIAEIAAALRQSDAPQSEGLRIAAPLGAVIRSYVEMESRHLALENAVVLSIAAVRLRKSELAQITRSMKNRREGGHVADA